MTTARWILGLVAAGSLRWMAAGSGQPPLADAADLRRLLPPAEPLPGWRIAEPPRVFRGDELFELIDGGAMLYEEYGFSEAVAGRYLGPGSASLQIEIYRMNSDQAAYGIYSMMQSAKGAAVAIGQEARRFDDYIAIWKGPYYISITALGPRGAADTALLDTARLIAARITETGRRPGVVDRLPAAGLLDRRYLRGSLALSNIHVFGPSDPFKATDGACGFYAGYLLFVFDYPDAARAAAQLTAARQILEQESPGQVRPASPAGFDVTDSRGNQITVRPENDSIRVRVNLATPTPSAGNAVSVPPGAHSTPSTHPRRYSLSGMVTRTGWSGGWWQNSSTRTRRLASAAASASMPRKSASCTWCEQL